MFWYFPYKSLFYKYYLRKKIRNCQNVQDLILVFKTIDFFYSNVSVDTIQEILVNLLVISPLTDLEMQRFSIMQQEYQDGIGIETYVTLVFWSCVEISILERETMF